MARKGLALDYFRCSAVVNSISFSVVIFVLCVTVMTDSKLLCIYLAKTRLHISHS